jgi:hypothetical protein
MTESFGETTCEFTLSILNREPIQDPEPRFAHDSAPNTTAGKQTMQALRTETPHIGTTRFSTHIATHVGKYFAYYGII